MPPVTTVFGCFFTDDRSRRHQKVADRADVWRQLLAESMLTNCWYHHCCDCTKGAATRVIRIKIVRRPSTPVVDGIRFGDFELGLEYLVGPVTGAILMAEGWGVPIDAPSPAPPSHEPVHVVRREIDPAMPPNLIREHWPPSAESLLGIAADRKRRRSDRR